MGLTYRAKRYEAGARGVAVFDDGIYLGDAIPLYLIEGRQVRKHPSLTVTHIPIGWQAHPASESHPLCPDDDPTYVRLLFASQLGAAKALRLRARGWTAQRIMGLIE